jgi:hypothetical protein
MQKLKWINLIVVVIGIFLFGACEYATIQPDAPIPPPLLVILPVIHLRYNPSLIANVYYVIPEIKYLTCVQADRTKA